MNETTRLFFDAMLIRNPAVMTFLGAIVVLVVPRSARSSFRSAFRIALGVFFAAFAGGALAGAVPAAGEPLVYVVVALVVAGLLVQRGEFEGEWYGLPRVFTALPLLIGIQMAMGGGSADLSMVVAGAAGSALGFAGAFVLMGAIREAVQLSEAGKPFKTLPSLVFSLALFSIALSGFLFW